MKRAVEVVAPEVAEEADRKAVERLDIEQQRDCYFTWRKDLDGGWRLRGKLGAVSVSSYSGVAGGGRKPAQHHRYGC